MVDGLFSIFRGGFWSMWFGLIAACCANAAFAEDRALIIGVDQYPHLVAKSQLTGAVNDAKAMASLARDIWGFQSGQIRLLLNDKAKSTDIVREIRTWLIDGTSKGDRVLLFYAGHGYFQTDTNGDESDGTDETLAPYDVRIDGKELIDMVSDDDIGKLLSQIGDRDVMMIVDSCHSGTITRALLPDQNKGPAIDRSPSFGRGRAGRDLDDNSYRSARQDNGFADGDKKLLAFSAVSPSEQAQEDFRQPTGRRVGVFTHTIVEGLRQRFADLNHNGVITPVELITYTRGMAHDYCQNFTCTTGMTPTLEGEGKYLRRDLLKWLPRDKTNENLDAEKVVTSDTKGFEITDLVPRTETAGVTVDILPRNQLYVGDVIKLRVTSRKPGWLILLDVRDNGEVVQLFPNRFKPGRAVRAAAPLTVPDATYGFDFTASEPGSGRIIAFVTRDNVQLDDLVARHRDLDVVPDPANYLASLAERLMRIWTGDERNRPANWSLVSSRYRIEP